MPATRLYRVRINLPAGTFHSYIDRAWSPTGNRAACTRALDRAKTWSSTTGASKAANCYAANNPGMHCVVVDAVTDEPAL